MEARNNTYSFFLFSFFCAFLYSYIYIHIAGGRLLKSQKQFSVRSLCGLRNREKVKGGGGYVVEEVD